MKEERYPCKDCGWAVEVEEGYIECINFRIVRELDDRCISDDE